MAGGLVDVARSQSPQLDAGQTLAYLTSDSIAGTNIEVSLMLDVTESMDGNKLSDLKEAAKDLVDIVVRDDQSAYKSRVALVPFAESVRLPGSAQKSAFGPSPEAFNKPVSFTKDVTQWHWYYGWQIVNQTYYKSDCLAERMGAQAFSDATPARGAYVTAVFVADSAANCGQASTNIITPLSSDKTVLRTAIDELAASGRAAGHLGTAWAWYTLSPNWNGLWAAPTNHAASYGASDTQKIAILMSDGAFNTQYTEDGLNSTSSDAPNGSSSDQAIKLCTAMKASGIRVYTVGFDLMSDSSAARTLAECATDASKAFTAADGKDLKQAFRAISNDITQSDLSS